MTAEWEEHDTWPSSNRHLNWSFECPKCKSEYVFYNHGSTHIVRTEDAEKHRAMLADRDAARRQAYDVAAPRYEQKWIDHVLSLPTKVAMKNALANASSYGTFLAQRGIEPWLPARARASYDECNESKIYDGGLLKRWRLR